VSSSDEGDLRPSVARRLFDRLVFLLIRILAAPARWLRLGRGRSLWAGTPILNLAINARADAAINGTAHSLVYHTYFITREFTYDLSRLSRIPVLGALLPYLTLFWAVYRYERFHFYCDRGLTPPLLPFRFNDRELALLRALGKNVYLWTYGADVRTRERTLGLGEWNCCSECPAPKVACVCDEHRGRENMHAISAHATAVFAMGDMLEYTPGSRNDLYFWPVDLQADRGERYRPLPPAPEAVGTVRVVHAPNHRLFKGTRFLQASIDRLRADGLDVELVMVERVPNREALDLYRSADIVFDQCLIGFHGYLAQEAMALAKPVVCFVRKTEYLLAPEHCPIVNVTVNDIDRVLRELILDRPRLHRLGLAGRAYIETHHSLEAFGRRLATVYAEKKS
jgi:hypothetical protein